MRIQIIYTGGTIGMVESDHGLVPGADMEGWVTSLLAPSAPAGEGADVPDSPLPRRQDVVLTELSPLIDSSNATPASWQAMVDTIRTAAASEHAPDAFVVLHGTDTMAYTCAALSYALTDLAQPVVVTGSQLPLGVPGSDAAGNLTGALHAAVSGRVRGVALYFGQRLLAGNRACKVSSWAFDGFDSPSALPLAQAGGPWHWDPQRHDAAGWVGPDGRPRAPLAYRRQDVAVIDLVPGTTASRLRAALTPLPDAVILRGFGVGNVPSDEPGLSDLVAHAVQAGVAVVVASQCQQAEVVLGRYATGDAVARAGAVGSGDMTLEALYAKVVFLLSQGLRGAELAAWVPRSIAGEVTEP